MSDWPSDIWMDGQNYKQYILSINCYLKSTVIHQDTENVCLFLSDFQQIELRLLAHLADNKDLIDIFNDPKCHDIFTELTSQWYPFTFLYFCYNSHLCRFLFIVFDYDKISVSYEKCTLK